MIEEKWRERKRHVGHQQAEQHTHGESPRREEKKDRKSFEGIMAENLPNLRKDKYTRSSTIPSRMNSTDPHQDIL